MEITGIRLLTDPVKKRHDEKTTDQTAKTEICAENERLREKNAVSVYQDDEYDSYSNIFDNVKTEITDADRDRLIESLKQLNEGENIESVVDVEEVIRYFVVHNFNHDSLGKVLHAKLADNFVCDVSRHGTDAIYFCCCKSCNDRNDFICDTDIPDRI